MSHTAHRQPGHSRCWWHNTSRGQGCAMSPHNDDSECSSVGCSARWAPRAPRGSLAAFTGPQDVSGWVFWEPPCCFDCPCALTLIHNQIYSDLCCKCKTESQRWKPHGKTKGTSALRRAGVSLCWRGDSSLHSDALTQTAFCILGDRCALQLLVEVKR